MATPVWRPGAGTALTGNYGVEEGFEFYLPAAACRQYDSPTDPMLEKISPDDEMLVLAKASIRMASRKDQILHLAQYEYRHGVNPSPRETPQSVSVMTRQRMNDQSITRWTKRWDNSTGLMSLIRNGFQGEQRITWVRDGQHQEDGVNAPPPKTA